jgi:hypothetical protein
MLAWGGVLKLLALVLQMGKLKVLRTHADGTAALTSRMQAEHSCRTHRSAILQTLYSG